MAQALSDDLRLRVTAAISQGKSRRGAAEQFSISAATAVRLQKRLETTGSVAADAMGRPVGSGKLGPYRDRIVAKVEDQPDIYHARSGSLAVVAAWCESRSFQPFETPVPSWFQL